MKGCPEMYCLSNRFFPGPFCCVIPSSLSRRVASRVACSPRFAQSSTSGKHKGESKSPITNFFPVKGSTEAANGGAGLSTPTKSKKRKLSKSSHDGAGTGSGSPVGFVAFCRANRSRVSGCFLLCFICLFQHSKWK